MNVIIYYFILSLSDISVTCISTFLSVVSKEIVVAGASKDAAKRDQTRTNKESGDRMVSGGHIGGAFTVTANPSFLDSRSAYFDTLWAKQEEAVKALQSTPELAIEITLPDG